MKLRGAPLITMDATSGAHSERAWLERIKAAQPPRIAMRGSDSAEVFVYGVIGDSWFGESVTATAFAAELKKIKNVKTIDVRINSDGGEVFAAKAMYTLLRAHGGRIVVHIDGVAASAASYLAMAGDEIRIAESGFIMIHEARGNCWGTAADMRRRADMVEQVNKSVIEVYVARTKNSEKTVTDWMKDDFWMSGKDAVAKGFADKVVENHAMAACAITPGLYRNVPPVLLARKADGKAALARLQGLLRAA